MTDTTTPTADIGGARVPAGRLAFDLLGVTAVLYGLGLMVENLYLMKFGAADFTLIKPRAVVTGLLLVTPIAFALALPIIFERPKPRPSADGWLRAGWHRLGFAQDMGGEVLLQAVPLLFYLWFVAVQPDAVTPRAPTAWIGVLLTAITLWLSGTIAAFLAILLGAVFLDKEEALYSALGQPQRVREPTTLKTTVILVVGLTFFAGGHLLLFVPNIYPSVPRQLGGARPQTVSLVVAGSAVDGLNSAGLTFATPNPPQIVSTGATTQPVKLLEAGETYYLVQLSSGETLQVASSVVDAVVLSPP